MAERSGCALTLLMLMSGCGGPAGVKATPGESSDDSGVVTSSSTTTTSGAATSSVDDSGPSRPTFELPAGCGDGVIVQGQYDCFFPVPVDWVMEELGGYVDFFSLDLEGDGHDELIALKQGWRIAVLRWEGGGLKLGPSTDSQAGLGTYARVQTSWDWNGDGRRDITILPQDGRASVAMHPSLGAKGLGGEAWEHQLPPIDWSLGSYGATGHAVPIDVDGDKVPEVLVSARVDGIEQANPLEDLVLFRRMGSTWQPVGEAYTFGPCGVLGAAAYGDFDGDGDQDTAVADTGNACDPYPLSYDPEWHRVGVLLSNSDAGVLELGGWYPSGGVVDEPRLWAADITGDEKIDLIIRITERRECDTNDSGICVEPALAVLRGRGDGSFENGNPILLDPILPSYDVQALIDVDGDGTREWIARLSEGRPWAIPLMLSAEGVGPLAALNDPEGGGVTSFRGDVGDLNADGVDDYWVRATHGPYRGDFLMISAP